MAGIVIVFDFDKTIIDQDSDDWVVDGMGITELFHKLMPTMPFNSLMDRMMTEIHSQGRTIEEMANCLKSVPLHPNIISAIKSAHALGCELRILSDANVFFIETILEHHGLMGYFSEINTNPSYIGDDDGKLTILPYHDFTTNSHGCSICPPNMCKGLIFERLKAEAYANGRNRFIYLGDGKGDFCPSLKLEHVDKVMPRKNYPLWELISVDRSVIKAEIHEWSDGEDLERILFQLINAIIYEKNNNGLLELDAIIYEKNNNGLLELVWTECKLQTVPVSTHKSISHVLPVPH